MTAILKWLSEQLKDWVVYYNIIYIFIQNVGIDILTCSGVTTYSRKKTDRQREEKQSIFGRVRIGMLFLYFDA